MPEFVIYTYHINEDPAEVEVRVQTVEACCGLDARHKSLPRLEWANVETISRRVHYSDGRPVHRLDMLGCVICNPDVEDDDE